MSLLRAGAFVAVAWNDGLSVGGTSLYVEAEMRTPTQVPLSDLRGIVRLVESTIRERWDHRSIDTGVPDMRAFAMRVAQVLAPELERRRFPLVAVTLREDPVWTLRYDVEDRSA